MAHRTERDIAEELLRIQHRAEQSHTATVEALRLGRVRTVELARRYGVPWQTIGDYFDMTADAARIAYSRGE